MNESPDNPAAIPRHNADWVLRLSPDEAGRLRSARRQDEAALKQYVLSLTGVYILLSAASLMFAFSSIPPRQAAVTWIMASIPTLIAFASIATNYGVRRSANWSRRPLIALSYLILPFP